MRANNLVALLLALSFVAFVAPDNWAGSTGKIKGTITDVEGQPLPGANVVIQGTRQGATSDPDGYFVIINVDPGQYRLSASMVGYSTENRQSVAVQADLTTTVNFGLQETALEAGEIVVIAERPAVEPDKTTSLYIIDTEAIEAVPLARTTQDIIELQPGVSLDGRFRIRGSQVANVNSNNETFVEVDGIRLVNNDGYNTPNFMGINKSALQEVQVVTGGMDAEYGNAQAGVIRLITRESRTSFGGRGEYQLTLPGKKHWGKNVYDSDIHKTRLKWGDPAFESETDPRNGRLIHQRTNYDDVIGHFVEASFNGPIRENTGFFLTSSHSRLAPTFPNAENREPFNIQLSGNATSRFRPEMKGKLGVIFANNHSFNPGGQVDGFSRVSVNTSTEGGVRSIGAGGRNLFLPGDYSAAGKTKQTESVFYGVFTHTVSPRTFYEVRLSYQRSLTDTSGVATSSENIRRADSGFYLERDLHSYNYADRKRWVFKADLSSQVTRGHFIKAGVEAIKFNVYFHSEVFADPRQRFLRLIGLGDPVIGIDPHKPTQYAVYIQDKMEFGGLVVNAGLRWDAVDPGKSYGSITRQILWPHYNSVTRWRNVPVVEADMFGSISPRLGVSHPVTDRSTIRFFSGVFRQYPDMQKFYEREYDSSAPDRDLNGNGQIDEKEQWNALIHQLAGRAGRVKGVEAEQTTNFEAGFDWNFSGPFVVSATTFYKDQTGVLGRASDRADEPGFGLNTIYTRSMTNTSKATSRGFEFSFRKKFSRMTSFNVAYNIQWVKISGNSGRRAWQRYFIPDPAFVGGPEFFVGVTVQPDGQEVPKPPDPTDIPALKQKAVDIFNIYLDRVGSPRAAGKWESPLEVEPGIYIFTAGTYTIPEYTGGNDRRNFGSIQFLFASPSDYHLKALAALRATLLFRLHTGTPYNYSPPAGGEQRRNGPLSTVTDINVEKDFRIGNTATATAFLEVRNLWNQSDDVTRGFNWVQYGLQLPQPLSADAKNNRDPSELTRHNGGLGRPRNVVLGARIKF